MSWAFKSSWRRKKKIKWFTLHYTTSKGRSVRRGRLATFYRTFSKLTSTERLNGILKAESLLMLFLSVLIYLHQAEDWWRFAGMKAFSLLKLKKKCQNYTKIQLRFVFARKYFDTNNCKLFSLFDMKRNNCYYSCSFSNIINFIERENNIYSHYFYSNFLENIKFHINIIKS